MGVSALECRLTLKYWSKVVMAVSKTTWQFGQRSKWRLIAVSAEGASFPSKYQQIKWIVSLQVIVYIPQNEYFQLDPILINAISEPKINEMSRSRKALKNRTLVAGSGLKTPFVSILRLKSLHASASILENRSGILAGDAWRGEIRTATS